MFVISVMACHTSSQPLLAAPVAGGEEGNFDAFVSASSLAYDFFNPRRCGAQAESEVSSSGLSSGLRSSSISMKLRLESSRLLGAARLGILVERVRWQDLVASASDLFKSLTALIVARGR